MSWTANEIERCPKCHGVIALIGRVHLCRPTPDWVLPSAVVGRSSAGSEQRSSNSPVAGSSPAVPAKPRFGDVVNVPLSEMPARGIGPKEVRKAAEIRMEIKAAAAKASKPRAKKGTATYAGYKDPEQRRVYQRELMRKRRAKT